MAEFFASGESPDILFWVGCAGSFDQRAQKITKAFVTILDKVGINYAILGKEEMCTGDPARRAGNEFMFQMMAFQNIQVLNNYGVKKIVTDIAVLDVTADGFKLIERAPGITEDEIRAKTAGKLIIEGEIPEMVL